MMKIRLILILTMICSMALCQTISSSDCNDGKEECANDEMDALQIPSSELTTIKSEELLDRCLDFPYGIDILGYDDAELGCDYLATQFNGYRELSKRNDFVEAVISKFEGFFADSLKTLSSQENGLHLLKYRVLRYICIGNQIPHRLDSVQSQRLKLALRKNNSIKKEYISRTIGKTGEKGKIPNNFNEYDEIYFMYETASENLLTLNRTPFNYQVLAEDDFTDTEKAIIDNHLHNKYGVTVDSSATAEYNCHAYAWYMYTDNSPLNIWLNSYDPYLNDWSYEETLNESEADIVVYINSTINKVIHSARRIGNNQYRSKWGPFSLVTHGKTNTIYNKDVNGNVTQGVRNAV